MNQAYCLEDIDPQSKTRSTYIEIEELFMKYAQFFIERMCLILGK